MSNDRSAAGFAAPSIARATFRGRRPPVDMNVWLGANSHGEMAWFRSHSLNPAPAPERVRALGATISFGYAVIHMVFHGLPDQRMRLQSDAQRSLRRIWTPRERAVWPPRLVMRPRDLTPLAVAVTEQCTFERAVSAHPR